MSLTAWELVAALVATAFAFAASAWVNAVSRLGHARARRLAEHHPRKGALLLKLADEPRPYLAATLLVMLVARVSVVVLVASVLHRLRVPGADIIAVAVMVFVLFQFAELAPRSWVLEHPDQIMLLAARPVWLLGTALRPVVTILVGLNRVFMLILPGRGIPHGPLASEEEIMSILEVAESEDVIETDERQMINSIFEFGDTVVREVMVPRPDMVCMPAGAALPALLDLMLDQGFTRVPVIDHDIDDIVGIAHARDVMRAMRDAGPEPGPGSAGAGRRVRTASAVAREAYFVPESKKVLELLREFQAGKMQMAIVVDEYGGTAGLVTMEDLLEEIVGEIADEHDKGDDPIETIDEHHLRVIARLGVDELSELLDVDLPSEEWDSVGGLVAGTLGRVPAEGDRVSLDGVSFQVERMNGRRIGKILVHHHGGAAGAHQDPEPVSESHGG